MSFGFQQQQRAFAAYIRNPKHTPVPDGVDAQRIAVYSELFFNNIDGFLASCFPVIRTILADDAWETLVRDFFTTHQCKTPYFSEIAEEFLAYLQYERNNEKDFPFLVELAHYEWVEMALSIAQDELVKNVHPINELSQKKIGVSPLAWPLAYRYPVHRISPKFLPNHPPSDMTFLIVHRDVNDKVHFFSITAMTYQLLELIEEGGIVTTDQCLVDLATLSGHELGDVFKQQALGLLQDLAERHIVTILH